VVWDHGAAHEDADEDEPHSGDRESERAASRGRLWSIAPGGELTLGREAGSPLPLVAFANDRVIAATRDERKAVTDGWHQVMSTGRRLPLEWYRRERRA
jgi:hypothetical protein